MLGDGNCCFTSLATSIKHCSTIADTDSQLSTTLSADISKQDIADIAHELRCGMVEELRQNSDYYKGFLSAELDIQVEADRFLQDGFFDAELGNLMISSLSNFLGTPIIVFTSIRDVPLLHFAPKEPVVQVPILVAYNQSGLGHYDSVAFVENSSHNTSVTQNCMKLYSCSCGKNDHIQQSRCVMSSSYSSRCPCLKAKSKCTTKCNCRGCQNPYGKDQTTLQPIKCSKKRKRHSLQIKSKSTAEVVSERSLKVATGPWSLIECYVLEGIISRIKSTSVEQIYQAYCEIVDYSEFFDLNIPIGIKSVNSVAAKIKQHLHQKKIFDTFFHK